MLRPWATDSDDSADSPAAMPDTAQFALFLAAAALLAVTPGPGLFYVAARTLAGGRAEGIASSFGTAGGGLLHVLAGALGVSAVVMASAEWFTALKWLGALYLAWLGIRTIRSARRDAGRHASDGVPTPQRIGVRRALREGLWVEALNPKTAAFFLAFIPQFVDPAAGSVPLQFIVLGLVSVAMNTGVDVLVALAAGRVRERAASHPARIRRLREASGAGLLLLGAGLLLARRSSA